ncbi:hypothetical protein SRB5_62500 [Streptomyces sp. RB5]|uniref:Uncharacterized protein n=1 Tax=Streptomyces smaragdinus TaxID=2585196 RepID=A0A7K0CRD8_9ACTN|nr:fructose PTS transporter subunit IIA [Streptomyces smaragdinus]MQY16058.1 hypothetical protein [Streptomyces smaragdinus]
MTSPASSPGARQPRLVAVTACPAGIAHTYMAYMAAEKLEQAARAAGYTIKVETQDSVGAENVLTEADVAGADAVIVAADTEVDPGRFRGKPLLVAGIGGGISHADALVARAGSAPVYEGYPGAVHDAHHHGGMTAVDGTGTTMLRGTAHTVDAASESAEAYEAKVRPPVAATRTPRTPTTKLVTVSRGESGEISSIRKLGGGPVSALSGYLTARTVRRELAAGERDSAIGELVELVAGTGKVVDRDALVSAVLAREARGATGLGEEVAIPHAETDAVTEPVVAFARSARGVDWGAVDGTPARLIFLVCVPEAMAGDERLRILARLARTLVNPDFRARLRGAGTDEEILRVLAEVG